MRTETKKIRFSPDEWATVEVRAKDAGIAPSAFVRQAALNQLPARIPELNHEAWVRLAPVLSNLNQLVRHINLGSLPDPRDLLNVAIGCRAEVGALRLELLGAKEEDE